MNPEAYEDQVFARLLPGAILHCDLVAGALAYDREYQHSKGSPWFERAAAGYVRAYYYSRREEPLTKENRARRLAETFVGRVKREPWIAEEEIRWASAIFAEEGMPDYRNKLRDALKNRKRYLRETNPAKAKTDEIILTLWLPALLWLMDDKAAAFAIRAIRNRDGQVPLKDFEISAKGYQSARLRLRSIGLRSWHDFSSVPPVYEVCSLTGRLRFTQASQVGFNFEP